MRVYKLALQLNIGTYTLIECLQGFMPGDYTQNTNLSQDLVDYIQSKYPVVPKLSASEITVSQKIDKLYKKADLNFRFTAADKDADLYSYNLHKKYVNEIYDLMHKLNKYALLEDFEILKLLKFKVKTLIKIQKALKKEREYDCRFNINSDDDHNSTDYSTPFENHWNGVFGAGDEANDAYWNTE